MFFKKKNTDKVNEAVKNETAKPEPEKPVEEWIWVEGYKATERDMKCRDYQYTLGELHKMPNDSEIKECESGFHFCRDLKDVFNYYGIHSGHRFFKVCARVRKSDYESYGDYTEEYMMYRRQGLGYLYSNRTVDKLVARSIVFERELTPDEILERFINLNEWSDEYKRLALEIGIDNASDRMRVDTLTDLGYSETFAKLIIDGKKFDIAKAVASQEGLSMDMKCWLIFK